MSQPSATAGRVRARHGIDILFAVALTALALAGWWTTYAGPGWWIAAAVAALLSVLIAVAISDAGGGAEFVLLALLLVYLVAAGPITAGALTLPGIDGLEQGISGTGRVWTTLLTTHPPVDATGSVLLAPVLVGLFAPGLSVSLAVRSRRMLAPLVPPALALVAVLLLGRYEPVSVLAQGAAFGGVAILWMRVRALRLEEAQSGRDPSRHWRIAGSTGLILVAVLVASAVTGPASSSRLVLRDQVAAYDVARLATPLDTFRHYTQQPRGTEGNLYDDRLLRVTGAPAGTRIRFAALDAYGGQRWTADNDTDPGRTDDRFLRLSTSIDNPATGQPLDVSVTLGRAWALPWVPTVGSLQTFERGREAGADPGTEADALRYNPATQTGVVTDELQPGDRYSFRTRVGDDTLSRTMEPSTVLDPDLYAQGEFLDEALALWTVGALTPMDALAKAAAALKKIGRYSDGAAGFQTAFEAGHSVERLGEDFVLAAPTVGNDEQYAAVMALVANRLRIPARVVVGAVLRDNGAVVGRDVEAWVEVRIADGTWRTLPTETFMGRRPPEQPTGGPRVGPRVFPPPTLPPDQPRPEPEPDDRLEPDEPSSAPADDGSPLGLMLLGLPVLLLGTPPVVKAVRRRRRLRSPRPSARYSGAWLELVDHARDLGQPVPSGLTRPAEARLLERVGAPVGVLAAEADRQVFAATPPRPADAADFWDLVRDRRSGLTASVRPWRRIWAFFSPASLRRPRPM